MYTEALNAVLLVGNIKVALVAGMVVFGIGSIVVWLVRGLGDDDLRGNIRTLFTQLCWALPLLFIVVVAAYSLPILKEEVVIAKQVAPLVDDYMERHPESVYNPDVVLTATNDMILGIAATAVELPRYIKALAEGGLPALLQTTKRPEDMSRDELLRRVQELESK